MSSQQREELEINLAKYVKSIMAKILFNSSLKRPNKKEDLNDWDNEKYTCSTQTNLYQILESCNYNYDIAIMQVAKNLVEKNDYELEKLIDEVRGYDEDEREDSAKQLGDYIMLCLGLKAINAVDYDDKTEIYSMLDSELYDCGIY